MSNILLAWELGGGLGHLGPFGPVADRLVARGHAVTVAARDVERACAVFGTRPVQIVQAPVSHKTYHGLADPPLSYSEILMRYGYLDAPQLSGLVRAWRGLLELTRADVLVADHAPSALLAARGLATSRVLFGSPFSVPPAVDPTPAMRSWVEVPRERLASSDAAVLKAINASLPDDVPALGAVHEIFADATRLYTGVPVLDPYGAREAGDYLGLYNGTIASRAPSWPGGEGARVFVYLHADYPQLDHALAALAESGSRCLVYLLGGSPARWQKYQGPRLVFSAEPVDVAAAAADSEACVCHGGAGMINSVLRAGKPLLLVPSQLEQFLVAKRVEKLGCARVVHPDEEKPDLAGALAGLLGDPAAARAAREFALRHREPAVDTIVERAAGRIEALARPGPG